MRLFSRLYDRTLQWSRHRHAERYLVALSAAESIFFPVPPDVMLAPMTLAQPERWLRLATVCTLASVIGGVVGYALGHFALEAVMPWIERAGHADTFARVHALFERYGFWIVFIAGFTPIPYKIFTIASGAAGLALLPFIAGSLVGRGGRFLLVAGLIAWGGAPLERVLRRYVEWLGWVTVVGALVAWAWIEWSG
ncbi:MAG TPA: YqaA family protein [Xanthomonadaceae bacterium]|nr:YqaA family protein [Xanthomonadaceae bacterium]